MIGELFVKIGADFKDLEKGFENAQKKIDTFGKNTEKLGKGFIKNVSLPIAGAVTGIIALGVKASQSADRIDKMSEKLGLSRDTFQKYDFILSQSGTSVDSMGSGMKKLTENITGVLGGVDGATDNFNSLGVEVVDVNGNIRDQEDVFEDLIKSFQSMENGVEKTKMAQEVFGRAGQELLPLLNQQSGSLEGLEEKFKSLGISMSDDAVDAGVEFTDTLDQLKRSFGASVAEIGSQFLPMLNDMMQFIIKQVIPNVKNFVDIIINLIDRFKELSPEKQKIIGVIIGIAAAIGPLLLVGGKLIGVFALLVSPIGLVVVAIAAITAGIIYLYNTNEDFKNFVLDAWEKIKTAFQFVGDIIKSVIEGDISKAIGQFEDLLFGVTMISEEKIMAIGDFLHRLKDVFMEIFEFIKVIIEENFIPVFKKIFEVVETVFDSVKETIMAILPEVLEFIKNILGSILLFWETHGEKIMKFVSFYFNVIRNIFVFVLNVLKTTITFVFNFIRIYIVTALQVIAKFVQFWVAIFTGDWSGAFEKIKEIFAIIWDAVKEILVVVLEFLKNLFLDFAEYLKSQWELIRESVISIVNKIKDKIIEIWNSIIESIKTVINNIVTFIRDKFNSIRDTLFGIMGAIGSKIKETFNNVVTDIKNSINKVIDLVNGVISKFNGIKINLPKVDIPEVKILGFETPAFSVGGQSFGVPQIPSIPRLADGGIINKPTLAMIGEGGESEAVIPLSKLAGLKGNNETHIYLDGKEITRTIAPQMVDMLRAKLAY